MPHPLMPLNVMAATSELVLVTEQRGASIWKRSAVLWKVATARAVVATHATAITEAGLTLQRSRLQSLDPTECPFSPVECYLELESRYSLGLHPLQGLPGRPLGSRPPLMHLRRSSRT